MLGEGKNRALRFRNGSRVAAKCRRSGGTRLRRAIRCRYADCQDDARQRQPVAARGAVVHGLRSGSRVVPPREAIPSGAARACGLVAARGGDSGWRRCGARTSHGRPCRHACIRSIAASQCRGGLYRAARVDRVPRKCGPPGRRRHARNRRGSRGADVARGRRIRRSASCRRDSRRLSLLGNRQQSHT
jgi:hypothetical protein